MTVYTEAITDEMSSIAKTVFDMLGDEYYLSGGTALALHVGHRKSVDLDYFINAQIDTLKLKDRLFEIFAKADVRILFEEKNTLWCSINGVKISFIYRREPLIDEVHVVQNFRLARVKDITVMKLSAICGREEYKDYFDLACLASVTDVRSWVPWWEAAYPNADYTSFLVALSYADKIKHIPLEVFDTYKDIDVTKTLFSVTNDITTYISHTES